VREELVGEVGVAAEALRRSHAPNARDVHLPAPLVVVARNGDCRLHAPLLGAKEAQQVGIHAQVADRGAVHVKVLRALELLAHELDAVMLLRCQVANDAVLAVMQQARRVGER